MPVPTTVSPLPALVPEQQHLDPFIPTVYGNIDYRRWQSQLVRIDEILRTGMVEASFQRLALAHRNTQEKAAAEKEQRVFRSLSTSEQESAQELSSQALRCNLARTLTEESYRRFACHLAESPLLQWFCGMGRLDGIHIPGKSTLQRYSEWIPELDMRKVVDSLLTAATQINPGKKAPGLAACGFSKCHSQKIDLWPICGVLKPSTTHRRCVVASLCASNFRSRSRHLGVV